MLPYLYDGSRYGTGSSFRDRILSHMITSSVLGYAYGSRVSVATRSCFTGIPWAWHSGSMGNVNKSCFGHAYPANDYSPG
jgi:hypothetical protein